MPLATNTDARYSVPGVGRPFLRSHLPDADKGKAWRQSVGNGYTGPIPFQDVPDGRNFRVRLGLNFQLGRGYRLGYGASDPYYADPSEQALPYAVDASGLEANRVGPEQLKAQRWSISGVARPFLRAHYPSASFEAPWRRSIGNAVGIDTDTVDIDVIPSTISPSEETASTPTYTEELV